MPSSKAVTIIIPVYADWPSLKVCLDSVKENVAAKHKVILVNDCGPQADLLEKNIKQAIKKQPNFFYYRNPENLGFVKTCNRAVNELDKTPNDILLLNSDTKVTKGFLEEMTKVLYLSPKYVAASPRSNNASIATVPLSQAIHHGINPKKSYAIYQKIRTRLPRYYEAPVALGFCMLIKRGIIKKYGLFDPIFGRGYGEEVDFSRRLKKQGCLCVFSNRAFVFHMEAKSFSVEQKKELMDGSNQIIWKRYPDYRQEVRDWMDEKVPAETAIEQSLGIYAEPKAGGVRGLLKPYPTSLWLSIY